MDKIVHKLILDRPFAKTACGLKLIAIYTPSYTAMRDEVGKDPIWVSHDKGVTCKECKEAMKDDK